MFQGPQVGSQSTLSQPTMLGVQVARSDDHAAPSSAFALPGSAQAKASAELVGADERHFARIERALEALRDELTERLSEARRRPAGSGQAALDADQEVRRLSARLGLLERHSFDLCLGRMVPADGSDPVYVGRLGLADRSGDRLLVDWRTPAAEPFFAATSACPMGLSSRRRYRWSAGRIIDYWDEALDLAARVMPLALDEDSAFIASLGAGRSTRMQDVLGTLQADQDSIIRSTSRGALVVDGGPGTGKTVVALHRAAYLLYADPRVGSAQGGVLFIGPSHGYLAWVSDVLPALGEQGVSTCTLADLVPGGAALPPEPDPVVAALKSGCGAPEWIEPAVALYEEPPRVTVEVDTPYGSAIVTATDWADAFGEADPAMPHNQARDQVWEVLLDLLLERRLSEAEASIDWQAPDADGRSDVDPAGFRQALARDRVLAETFSRGWVLLEPSDVVADLYSVPAYLRRCAPELTPDQVRSLQREDPTGFTAADIPLLDAARRRVGDPDEVRRRHRAESRVADERRQMDQVVEHLIAADYDSASVLTMLTGADLRAGLADQSDALAQSPERLQGPFAHVIVDEAQELTDAQWQMVRARCPSGSVTVVGDRAQAREGFPETWEERLSRIGLRDVRRVALSVNYRTPQEVMEVAGREIQSLLPDANVPDSVRRSGVPVRFGVVAELDPLLREWLAGNPTGQACVIGEAWSGDSSRVHCLDPSAAKGLEFDLVVLVRPAQFGAGVRGAVDRYVAMTRATSELVVLD